MKSQIRSVLCVLGGAAVVLLAGSGQEAKPEPTDHSSRFTIVMNSGLARDLFLLDTRTGDVWLRTVDDTKTNANMRWSWMPREPVLDPDRWAKIFGEAPKADKKEITADDLDQIFDRFEKRRQEEGLPDWVGTFGPKVKKADPK